MHPDDLLQRFRAAGALYEGHFQLSSGLHSPGYLQSAQVARALGVPAVKPGSRPGSIG